MYFFTCLVSMDRADYGLQGKFYEAASVFDPLREAELNEEDIESRLKLLSSHPKFKETLIDDLIEQIPVAKATANEFMPSNHASLVGHSYSVQCTKAGGNVDFLRWTLLIRRRLAR